MPIPAFHHAFTVYELQAAKAFYTGLLGAEVIAEDSTWIVFDFFGHKLTANLATEDAPAGCDDVALRHFGVILSVAEFEEFNAKLVRNDARIVSPARLLDETSERAQWVLFVQDPSGNGLEFNAFPRGDWQSSFGEPAPQRIE